MNTLEINGKNLTISQLYNVSHSSPEDQKVKISNDALKAMTDAREYVYSIVEKADPVYGINTGFGALSNKYIGKEDLKDLQINLIRSHCTGVGKPLNKATTRAIMFLRANCLASGFSGINPEIVQCLLNFLNKGVHPIIPEKGSVGASGDLAPLSHIALSLIGEGKVEFKGEILPTRNVLEKIGIKPIELGPKDGLALINGTAFMSAFGGLAVYEAHRLLKLADVIAALTVDSLTGTNKAFSKLISNLKPHKGQLDCCKNLNILIPGSEILNSHKGCGKVQDPYSLRCVPQVHGACRQTFYHAKKVLEVELNSVTDNPLVFPEQQDIISGGNFHGEAVALAMDYLSMGMSEICNISERRVEKMMNPNFSNLPAFLTEGSGLNSGLMIAHVTSAALTSENKTLCFPSSVDSIPTSTDKEDHVSMGPFAGRKLHQIIKNTKYCLAIELLCNTTALDFRRPLKTSKPLESLYENVRKIVPPIKGDRAYSEDIERIVENIDNNNFLEAIENITGELK